MTSPHLECLHISNNKLESIEGLDIFGHLKYLDMKKNNIGIINCIDEMKNLRYIDISENKLTSLGGFTLFPVLETLIANRNMIKSIAGLKSLAHLSYLDLRQNCIQNLDGLPSKLAPYVKTLYLDSNPIIDPVNLLFLRPFVNLEKLSICETPMAKKITKNK
jgi:internalin A